MIWMPPAAPRSLTSSESAGVDTASAASHTGVPACGDGFGGDARETIGAEARVIADQNAGARLFRTHDVTRDRVRDFAYVLEGEIFGDDGSPAVGAKLNVAHGKSISEGISRRKLRQVIK